MKPIISIIIPVYNDGDLLERALRTVPLSPRYQIIILDDGSTDNSWEVARKYYDTHCNLMHRNSIIHRWTDNRGIATTMNLGFSLAEGDYIVSLSSDDYFLAGFYEFLDYLDGKNDLVYFDLEVNDGSIWHLEEDTKRQYVGAVKFIRREFLGDTRIPLYKYEEDAPFSGMLYAKNPKEVFTGIVLKHYNWPRVGSLSWQAMQDKEKDQAKYKENSGIASQKSI